MTEELLYEGKAKKVYATGEEGVLVHRYKDDATAFDGRKRGSWKDKGRTNATMSATIFTYLEANGVPTVNQHEPRHADGALMMRDHHRQESRSASPLMGALANAFPAAWLPMS